MPLVWKAWSFFKRDLLTDISYKLSFAFQVVDILAAIGAYYFLARIIGKAAYGGYEPFQFILVGLAVNGYMTTCLVCFSQGIRGNQPLGTLKMVLVTPTPPVAFILFSSLYPLARATIDAALYLLGGALFGLSLRQVNFPALLLIYILSALAFSSIGILSAIFTLVFKRGDPFIVLFGALSWLLGGVYYPIEVLPSFLRHASQFLPITHATIGMRAALLGNASMAQMFPHIAILALFALVGLPVSLLGFTWGVRWARVAGTLSHF
jgi:ABC-2 type transport system permease protein